MGSTTLGEVKTDRAMRLACAALFNHLRIKAGGCAVRYDDAVATYAITTDDKLTKARAAEARTFLAGVLAGFRGAGLI